MNTATKYLLRGALVGLAIYGVGSFLVRAFEHQDPVLCGPQIIRVSIGLASFAVSVFLWFSGKPHSGQHHDN